MGPHKVLAATERRCRPRSYESGRRDWRLRVEEGWRLKEKLTRGVQVAASGGRLEGEGETDSLSVLVHTKVLAPIRSQYTKLERAANSGIPCSAAAPTDQTGMVDGQTDHVGVVRQIQRTSTREGACRG